MVQTERAMSSRNDMTYIRKVTSSRSIISMRLLVFLRIPLSDCRGSTLLKPGPLCPISFPGRRSLITMACELHILSYWQRH
jgi:hypothetical protein